MLIINRNIINGEFPRDCVISAICNTLMESGVANEHEGQLYCRLCHGKKFGPKGYGFGGGSGCLSTDAAQRHGNTQTDMR